MACVRPVRIEPFPMFSTNNSALGVDDHPFGSIEPKDFNSLSEGPVVSLRSVIVPRCGMGARLNVKTGAEMPWCLQAEESSILQLDTIADRQTLCPHNQVNQGSSTALSSTKSRVRSKIPQYGGNLSRMTERGKNAASNPNVPVDSSRRRLFAPQVKRSHKKIITISPIVQQLTDTSQPSTNIMMMQRSMNVDLPIYEHSTQRVSRPKSESINIKRARGYDDSSHFDSSAERMYDWATWKMYHRITTARTSRASIVPFGANSRLSAIATSAQSSNSTHESDGDLSDRTPSLASFDSELDGEVFEIEI